LLRTAIHLLGNAVALLTAFGLLARFVPPDALWPPAIVALLLPGLLLITLLAALLFLYRRRWKAAVIPVLTILLALPMSGRLFAFGVGKGTDGQGPQMTIATVNAHGFKTQAWTVVPEEDITDMVQLLNAEVLMVQEAGVGHGNSSKIPFIKAAGPYPARLQPRNRMVATFADNLETIATSFKTYNGFSVADVQTSLGKIRFINAHLQSNRISVMAGEIGQDDSVQEELDRAESMFRSYGAAARTRAKQAEEIRGYVLESPHPVIVGGDFNDVPSSYTYQQIRTDRLRDAWAEQGFGLGTTFTGPLPGLRIDFLLVDTSLTVVEVERVETDFSDHRALRAVIE